MKKEDFLNQIKQKCSQILHISTEHIINKVFKTNEEIPKEELIEFFSNYKNYHIYLNDFAGTIYSKYGSSVDNLYIEMCGYLGVQVDNKYTLEHTIAKLEKQTPQLLLSLTDADIQKQTIVYFDEKLNAIEGSIHYKNNIDQFKNRVDKLKQNIILVKKALNI
jgi:hypothetical protein